MYRISLPGFDLPVVTLHPGDVYSSSEDLVICTILGSCVAVSLFDPRTGMGGLNHFMLPGPVESKNPVLSPNAKYGMYAMELLINDMIKKGARKSDLIAKVFGAASVLDFSTEMGNRIPRGNIEFTFSYLAAEGIPVAAKDVGGTEPRKVFLFAHTGKVLLKRIPRARESAIRKEEVEYLKDIQKRGAGPVRIFRSKKKG
jgi:chemotaxis protein CheD